MFKRVCDARDARGTGLNRRVLMTSLVAIMAMPGSARAQQQDTLLRVSGSSGTVVFDRAALEALPQITFRTSTVWTTEVQEFTGPSLASVLNAAGAKGEIVVLDAVNAYRVEISMEEISDTV